jgi:hypothetical protein
MSPVDPSPPPARSVAAAAGERHVLELDEAGAVLAQQPLLEAPLPQRVPAAVERDRAGRLPDRVAAAARAQHHVPRHPDRGEPRVGPGRPQLALGPDRDGPADEERVAVVDAAAPAHARDGPVVAAPDPPGPALGAAIAAQRSPEEAVVRAAAAEELGLDAAAADPRVAAGAQAALVGGDEPPRLPARGALRVHAEHPARAGVAQIGDAAALRALRRGSGNGRREREDGGDDGELAQRHAP